MVALFLASCEKEIILDLNNSVPQLVIEGNISDASGPYIVKLTKTVDFYDSNIYPPVSGAFVVISDNSGVIDTLTEETSGIYQTHTIIGTQGNTYAIKVIAEGKQYDAISTMPYKIDLDSVDFVPSIEPGSTEETFAVVPRYLDPIEFGNSYRFLFTSNGVADETNQVSNDNIGNGSVNQQPFFSDNVKYYVGDTVTVTMLCIDTNTYNFYYTLSQIADGGPIGGAIPSNPPTNFTGSSTLGLFSAYTTQTITAIVK